MLPKPEEFFREVTLRISSSLDITEALAITLDYVSRFMPIDTLGLHKIDLDEMCIFAVSEVVGHGATRSLQGDYHRIAIDNEIGEMIQDMRNQGTTVTLHNRPPEGLPSSVMRCFPQLATRSMLSLHLRIKNEPIGGLVLSAEGYDRYREEHAALLELVKEPIALAMSNAWRFHEMVRLRDLLVDENRALSDDIEQAIGAQMVGADFGLAPVMEMIRRVAPLSSPVLLLGETGTGKEVIANAIHHASTRSRRPMVRVQCGAIPETLLDSELFGHEKGAFTGAVERKRGRFERAHQGTIFLDEIGELTPEAQVKLLRLAQEKQFERVGGSETLTADVRIIAATHRDLAAMVREGTFREDLWYRLNVFPIQIPPLRMRREDIPSLVHYFIERKAREMNLGYVPPIPAAQVDLLQAYDWPGNVRELQNVIERALILSGRGPLLLHDFAAPPRTGTPTATASQTQMIRTMDQTIAEHIRQALAATGGRISGQGGAAALLDMHPNTLRFRMQKLGIRLTRAIQ